MDLRDFDQSRTSCKHENVTGVYYVSNAGQLFVKNINPFDNIPSNAGYLKQNMQTERNNKEFNRTYYETQSKEFSATPSKEINESLTNYLLNNYNEHLIMKERYEAILSGNQTPYSQPMVTMSATGFQAQYTSRSKDMYTSPPSNQLFNFEDLKQDNNRHGPFCSNEVISDHQNNNTAYENDRRGNNTNCGPLANVYNQQIVYKLLLKNAKLQKIVRKLVIAREREKQREVWNNYINDLKNKHRYYSNEPSRILPQYVPGDHNTPEMIDDLYNLRPDWRQSSRNEHLLADLHGTDNMSRTMHGNFLPNYENTIIPPDVSPFISNYDRIGFSTGSQSMLKMNKEQQAYEYNCRTTSATRNFRSCGVVDNKHQCGCDKIQSAAGSYSQVHHEKKPRSRAIPIQTTNLPLVNEEDKEQNITKAEILHNIKCIPYCSKATSVSENVLEQNHDITPPPKQPYYRCVPLPEEPRKITGLDNDVNPTEQQYFSPNKLKPIKNKIITKPINVQKSLICAKGINDLQSKRSFDEKFKTVTDNIIKLKQKVLRSEENTKLKSLATIEEKIDGLMESMNSMMVEIQAKRDALAASKTTTVLDNDIITANRPVYNRQSSDSHSHKNKNYERTTAQHSSNSLTITELGEHKEPSLSKILLEEREKSDKAKSDIEEILNPRSENSCSLQITIDIPTKERSTEVTDSLSNATFNFDNRTFIKKVPVTDQTPMTVAVNTDPLGWLTLLKISTQTIKWLLSYLPSMNYYAYLSLLPLMVPARQCHPHFTCNICGASFRQPSQLSDHVKQHSSGKTRDCCVCRHSLDALGPRGSLFTCKHCGQRFTRAYCCELHQQSCARLLGKSNDVTSSHVLLQ